MAVYALMATKTMNDTPSITWRGRDHDRPCHARDNEKNVQNQEFPQCVAYQFVA
jgi:hypothetical protein